MKKLFLIVALMPVVAMAADQNKSVVKVDLDKVKVDVGLRNVLWRTSDDDKTKGLQSALFYLKTYSFDLKKHGLLLKQVAKAAILAHEDAQEIVLEKIRKNEELLAEINDDVDDQKEGRSSH